MHSCLYEGYVRHDRGEPIVHRFQYPLYMVYLDLAELPQLVGRGQLISDRAYGRGSFHRADHLRGEHATLDEEVRQWIERETNVRPTGPIRLLTQLRSWGHYFSPLNLFFVYDASGRSVETILAEVNNTPWKERHGYVLWAGNQRAAGDVGAQQFEHPKQFHVSPFMDMALRYRWQLTTPDAELGIQLANFRDQQQVFRAELQLHRQPLTRQNLRRLRWRYPWMTVHIVAAIYFQAFQLWWKKCPFYPHPNKSLPSLPPESTQRA